MTIYPIRLSLIIIFKKYTVKIKSKQNHQTHTLLYCHVKNCNEVNGSHIKNEINF